MGPVLPGLVQVLDTVVVSGQGRPNVTLLSSSISSRLGVVNCPITLHLLSSRSGRSSSTGNVAAKPSSQYVRDHTLNSEISQTQTDIRTVMQ
jgi:hypothetical protein